MAYDALSLGILKEEFETLLIGGKITKIYQPEKDEIVLFVFNKSTYKLLISANASVNRIHVTNGPTDNPKVAPSFCMLLRKYIVNSTITSISQMPFERVLDFALDIKDELGYKKQMHLIFELTGKTSNIILTDNEYTVIDSVKHLPQDIESSRVIINGAKYTFFAPQNKIKPFDYDRLREFLQNCKLPLRTALTENVLGVSQATINEITCGIDENDHTIINNEKVLSAFKNYEKHIADLHPCVVLQNGNPVDVCPFDYASKKGEKLYFPTLNEAHDNYYYLLDKTQRFNDKAKSISTVVKNAISRTEKKLAIQRQSILDSQELSEMKVYGDLILANLYRINKNDTSLTCENYYDESCPLVTIPLDAQLSPQQNAQAYYKKYRKMKSSIEHNTALVEENEKLLDYLHTVKESLRYSTESSDLEEIRNELVENGLIKVSAKNRKIDTPVKPLKYVIDGFTVYVGKNNVQNNYVTFKIAKVDDVWLHAQKIHSSHVAIITEGKSVPDDVIVATAEICAYYSQANSGTKLPIDYTAKKNVKKPNKSALGFVTYTDFSTVIVNPNRHLEYLA